MSKATPQATGGMCAGEIGQRVGLLEMQWGNGKTYVLDRVLQLGWRVRDEDDPAFLVTAPDLMELEAELNAVLAGARS